MSQTPQDVDQIKQKTKSGLISLFSRSFILYFLRAASIFLLARYLSPEDYGVFGILNSWVWGITLMIPDLSLFTALVQQKHDLSLDQHRNLFGFGLYRGLFILFLLFIGSSFIFDYQNLDPIHTPILLALGFCCLIDGIKLPFRVMIERRLDFKIIVYIELIETFSLYVVQIICAKMGFGPWSFVYGVLTRALIGLLAYYYFSPHLYLPMISFTAIKQSLHFETMVQIKKLIVGVKAMVMPIILGRILSSADYGILAWANGIAQIPVVFIHNYDRVLFPALARLQDKIEEFQNVASKGLCLNISAIGFIFGLIAAGASPAIHLFFPHKWDAAIQFMAFLCLGLALTQIRYLGGSILNAIGRPRSLLKLEAITIILEIFITFPVAYYFSAKGYLLALALLEFIVVIVMFKVIRQYLSRNLKRRFVATLMSAFFAYWCSTYLILGISCTETLKLVLVSLCYCFCYIGLHIIMDPTSLTDLKHLLGNARDLVAKRMKI